MERDRNAFILRIAPDGKDMLQEALEHEEIIIGWPAGEEILREMKWNKLRETIKHRFYPTDEGNHRAGNAAGNLWRFLRDMKEDDYAVVPAYRAFYVAEVMGPPFFDNEIGYRRKVRWLNGKRPIAREHAKAALHARLGTLGTCKQASDLLEEIEAALQSATTEKAPRFTDDLKSTLITATHEKLLKGYMDFNRFEKLIAAVLKGLGAHDVYVVPKQNDKGVDVVARFMTAAKLEVIVGVQAKFYKPEEGGVPPEVVEN
jgi:predicted Mrr-cat superfamily restriction endonuclease